MLVCRVCSRAVYTIWIYIYKLNAYSTLCVGGRAWYSYNAVDRTHHVNGKINDQWNKDPELAKRVQHTEQQLYAFRAAANSMAFFSRLQVRMHGRLAANQMISDWIMCVNRMRENIAHALTHTHTLQCKQMKNWISPRAIANDWKYNKFRFDCRTIRFPIKDKMAKCANTKASHSESYTSLYFIESFVRSRNNVRIINRKAGKESERTNEKKLIRCRGRVGVRVCAMVFAARYLCTVCAQVDCKCNGNSQTKCNTQWKGHSTYSTCRDSERVRSYVLWFVVAVAVVVVHMDDEQCRIGHSHRP